MEPSYRLSWMDSEQHWVSGECRQTVQTDQPLLQGSENHPMWVLIWERMLLLATKPDVEQSIKYTSSTKLAKHNYTKITIRSWSGIEKHFRSGFLKSGGTSIYWSAFSCKLILQTTLHACNQLNFAHSRQLKSAWCEQWVAYGMLEGYWTLH